jgi:hypothetical protein
MSKILYGRKPNPFVNFSLDVATGDIDHEGSTSVAGQNQVRNPLYVNVATSVCA